MSWVLQRLEKTQKQAAQLAAVLPVTPSGEGGGELVTDGLGLRRGGFNCRAYYATTLGLSETARGFTAVRVNAWNPFRDFTRLHVVARAEAISSPAWRAGVMASRFLKPGGFFLFGRRR